MAGRWTDSGSGPGWSPDDQPEYVVPDFQVPDAKANEATTKGTAWEMHDDPEVDLPEVPD